RFGEGRTLGIHGKHRPLVIRLFAFLLIFWAGAAAANCRQALALGLDVSGSVDAKEYALQMQGLAAALEDPQVLQALAILSDAPVQIAVYEWSSPAFQRLIVPWTVVSNSSQVADVTQVLRQQTRVEVPPTTGLGAAMQFGFSQLAERPNCWRHTLDISGDGKNNSGPRPRSVIAQAGKIEINALVIGLDVNARLSHEELEVGELTAYFRAEVIHGPAPFIEVALGFADYARAMRKKLLKELAIPSLSLLDQ
ncbi:MAG: DUF1194 domain-containing protein, partial [Planktomarina sp.]